MMSMYRLRGQPTCATIGGWVILLTRSRSGGGIRETGMAGLSSAEGGPCRGDSTFWHKCSLKWRPKYSGVSRGDGSS
ncbi:unnamed protein product [Protopolystoma xenopodis]|uniref:Uncharacterized protein n=1 Tax=Protopolystoma xenopodis TaxID=117903 RepID=A0A3S5BTS4_9PLAT|nr:unnamed protein product [Protopolystoma xenopodis]